jgi:hypothetical protein
MLARVQTISGRLSYVQDCHSDFEVGDESHREILLCPDKRDFDEHPSESGDALPFGQDTTKNILSIIFHLTFFTRKGDFLADIDGNNFSFTSTILYVAMVRKLPYKSPIRSLNAFPTHLIRQTRAFVASGSLEY